MCVKAQILRKYMEDLDKRDYDLKHVRVGCEVKGIDLKTDIKPQVISQIKDDVSKHGLLIFKNQGINEERQLQITKWFGDIDDLKQNVLNIPDTGESKEWKIGGNETNVPFLYAFYNIIQVSKQGGMYFTPLNKIVDKIPEEKKNEWEKIFAIDQNSIIVRPLIYRHPMTRNETLYFHPKMALASSNLNGQGLQPLSHENFMNILKDIQDKLDEENCQYVQFEEGDFIVADNLALAHKISFSDSKNGSIILHRTTTKCV